MEVSSQPNGEASLCVVGRTDLTRKRSDCSSWALVHAYTHLHLAYRQQIIISFCRKLITQFSFYVSGYTIHPLFFFSFFAIKFCTPTSRSFYGTNAVSLPHLAGALSASISPHAFERSAIPGHRNFFCGCLMLTFVCLFWSPTHQLRAR